MTVFGDENIVLLEKIISQYCDYKKFSGRLLTNNDLIQAKCDVLFTRSQTNINSALINNTNVKLIATATSGTDHVDLDYLKKIKIPFYDAKGSNANSVAEYVLYAILKWSFDKIIELKNLKIGIIGYGSIGKIVAYYANSIGLEVIVNDPYLKDSNFIFPDYVKYMELNDLINNSNILTNHVPLTYDGKYPTNNLLNFNNLSVFQNNGLIIHTSRGNVLDESVISWLNFDKSISFVIDVWSKEPNFNSQIADFVFIATPHIAGYSYNGKLNGTKKLVELFEKFSKLNVDKNLLSNEYEKSKNKSIKEFCYLESLLMHLDIRRKIFDDSKVFKELIREPENIRMKEFDNLRKLYPKRYELLSPFV
jgi:erythronate-4-phosphate dehydrogenase